MIPRQKFWEFDDFSCFQDCGGRDNNNNKSKSLKMLFVKWHPPAPGWSGSVASHGNKIRLAAPIAIVVPYNSTPISVNILCTPVCFQSGQKCNPRCPKVWRTIGQTYACTWAPGKKLPQKTVEWWPMDGIAGMFQRAVRAFGHDDLLGVKFEISRPTNHHAHKPVFICDISIHPPVFCHKNKGFGRASPNKYPWKLLWHICHKWGFQIRLEKFQKIFLQVPFSLEEYCIAWKSWIKIRNPKKSLIHEGAFWKTICSRVRVEP